MPATSFTRCSEPTEPSSLPRLVLRNETELLAGCAGRMASLHEQSLVRTRHARNFNRTHDRAPQTTRRETPDLPQHAALRNEVAQSKGSNSHFLEAALCSRAFVRACPAPPCQTEQLKHARNQLGQEELREKCAAGMRGESRREPTPRAATLQANTVLRRRRRERNRRRQVVLQGDAQSLQHVGKKADNAWSRTNTSPRA